MTTFTILVNVVVASLKLIFHFDGDIQRGQSFDIQGHNVKVKCHTMTAKLDHIIKSLKV